MAAGRACEVCKACPFHSRIQFEDLRNGSRPYLFGGAQRPACRNCHIDTLWANFCQYKNSGPVCYDWDIDGLSREFVARCALQQRPAPGAHAALPVHIWVHRFVLSTRYTACFLCLSQKGLGGAQHRQALRVARQLAAQHPCRPSP